MGSRVTLLILLAGAAAASSISKYPAEVFVGERRSSEDLLSVEIRTSDQNHKLRLRPLDYNIWQDNAMLITLNEKNQYKVFEDFQQNSFQVYQDLDSGSIVGIDGEKVSGIISETLTIKNEDNKHYIYRRNDDEEDYRNDYLIPPSSTFDDEDYSAKVDDRQISNYNAEVLAVVDSALAAQFANLAEIIQYLTVFWNAVNARFATIISPKFTIKLVSVIITLPTNEPFITNNFYNGNPNLIKLSTLYSFGDWIYSRYSTLPRFDTTYLQTGRDMVLNDGNQNLAGVAWVRAACPTTYPGPKYATEIGEDRGGYFYGVHTAAHEVAHNLGAPHDGDTNSGTGSCPWSEGYIMSYVSGSVNKLYFSPCSIAKMSSFASGSYGSCLRVQNNVNPLIGNTNKLPGHLISTTETCVEVTGNSNAVVANPSICYQLQCNVPINGINVTWYYSRPPPEGASCITVAGTGGRCDDGICNTTAIVPTE